MTVLPVISQASAHLPSSVPHTTNRYSSRTNGPQHPDSDEDSMASASDDHVSDDADDEDDEDDDSDPSDDPSNLEERECWNKKELALSGCLYDVHSSLSLPAPTTFSISRAYQLLEFKNVSLESHPNNPSGLSCS